MLFPARRSILSLLAIPLVLVLAACDGGNAADDDELRSFYLEATVDVEDREGTDAVTDLRWWYREPKLMRAEFDTLEPADEAGTSILVWDGDQQWFYNHREEQHSSTELPDLPEGMHPMLPVSTLLGPVPPGGIEPLLDEIAEEWELTASETMLGREVRVYEWGPTWTSSGPDGERSGGTARTWVDTERGMILRLDVDATDGGTGQSYTAEVTSLDWNVAVDDERFEFEPPPGSEQTAPSDNASPGGASSGAGSSGSESSGAGSSGSGSATAVPSPAN